jgi:hypothetical protein
MQCDLLHKLELLHNEGIQFTPPHAREVVRTLYDTLTVLDTKTFALLAFEGIVAAAASYSFLHYVECFADKLDFAREIDHLAILVDWRTAYYRIAWWLSIIAIPSFLIMFWTSLSWKKPDGK